MKKIAIIGFTPREEVLVDVLRKQNRAIKIILFTTSKNVALESRVDEVHDISIEGLTAFEKEIYDVVLIGPEKLSVAGIKEQLEEMNVQSIGCSQEQIKIETEKSFLRENFPVIKSYFPPHYILYDYDLTRIENILSELGQYVIKYNGTYKHIGGGTKLSDQHLKTRYDSLSFIEESINDCGKVVIEKMIYGIDFSVNALSARDGSVFFFPENYCYKMRDNGNVGPNTSGTGSFSFSDNLPFLSDDDKKSARNITKEAITEINKFFQKPLISGLNLDFRKGWDGQIYLLEINARFAGSGTLSTVLDICGNNLFELFVLALRGSFSKSQYLPTHNTSLAVFAYPKFFPSDSEENIMVEIPKAFSMQKDINLYTGWVEIISEDEDKYFVILKNSTTLLFQTHGENIKDCIDRISARMKQLPEELIYRNDIGDFKSLLPN